MSLIEYLDIDDEINVYIVGDIHGSYTYLLNELKKLNFNFEQDLLISVGDLVDRGEENEKCVDLINQPWFKCVRGNHEDYCIQGANDYHVEFYHKMSNNGGDWFYKYEPELRLAIADKFNVLPYLMEINYRGKKFGIAHADIPVEDWELLKEMLLNNDVLDGRTIKDHIIWARNIVHKEYVNIAQIDRVFLGHTVLPKVTDIGNCTFLDTGAVFRKYDNGYYLSIVRLSDYVES